MESFVYCWTDKKTNKLYVGSHKGSTEDGYICSSKYMLEEYKNRPEDFSRQIIAHGNLNDIRKLESKILKSVNARLNENFYNKHENDGFYFEGWKKGEMTGEHKKKLSLAKKGKKISKEHHSKLIASRKGSKNSPEHKAALVASRIDSKHTEKTKKKMSKAKKKNPYTKINASNAGKASVKSRPENYKELQSARIKLWWAERKKKIGG